ncbi:AraC family transcriptional regulator [uncultured Algibacter sp.]|uniref:helix-turn-helix domain-containing protein n=1 Tax=uncultured Algibacter sp. TaxID=298659 RepID=UPI00261AB776|nr:AraC family transcriptional regulator [uncultured Algibacter sp.]
MNDLLQSLKLRLIHTGFEGLDHNWNYKNVLSPFVRLILVTEGQATLHHTNQTFKLEPGYMYLIPSYTSNNYSCSTYHKQYYAGFFEEIKLGMSIFNIKHFNFKVKATKYETLLFKRLLEIHPNKKVTDQTPKSHINHSLFQQEKKNKKSSTDSIETQGILTILFSKFIDNKNMLTNNTTGFKDDLSNVLIYIGKHIHQEITVKQLAEYCHLSSDHFTKCFNYRFEITPNKYIQLKRIERAQFLLLTTKDSIQQIADQVGMSNTSYFSRKFKAITGFRPGSFRKQQLNRERFYG